MTLFLLDFKLTCPEGKRLGFDGENLADELVVYTDHVEDGSYYLDLEDEAGNRNVIALLKDGTRLHASITREMIGAAGNKLIQIRLCSGEETVKKSNTLSIYAGVSVNASEPFEHLQPSEFEEVERRVSEALQQAADYGVKGDKGNGIESIELTSTVGAVKTYTITFTDGTTTTFNVMDGKDGTDGKDGKDGVDGKDGKDGIDGTDGKDGVDGQDGEDGVRGGRILRITTDPSPYDTPIGDYQPRNRILKSVVISEAETDDVIPGDALYRAARYFAVQYVDDTYAYTGYGTLFKGDQGEKGKTGDTGTTYTPAVSSAGVISWTNDGGKTNPPAVDMVAAVIAALPTWTGGAY